jgi:glycosyltransferase involved in cell wall biosynthesis
VESNGGTSADSLSESGIRINFRIKQNLEMIKNRDIIVISLQAWDIDIGSNVRDIAKEFARYNRVLFINSPLDRLTILRHRNNPKVQKRLAVVHGRDADLVRERENLWVLNPRMIAESVSRMPWNFLFDRINRVNNIRFAGQIRTAVERLQFRDVIIFNDGNMFRGFYLKELISPVLYIYYSRDYYVAMDFWKTQGTRIEPALMSKSDLVLANSAYLANRAMKYNSRTYNVGQGCDVTLYNPERNIRIPEDIAVIPRPVIGYTGALLALRLDPGIISYIACWNPRWSVVLIGPEDEVFRNSDLHRLKNVFFLGYKHPDQLPAYIKCFDVAMNPQADNEITRVNYPRKVDEYLAMGKPVVATRNETMTIFSKYAYLASNYREYVENIEKALLENSPDRELERMEFAQGHSWEKNVEAICQIIEESLPSNT